jgi:hypothetical protein
VTSPQQTRCRAKAHNPLKSLSNLSCVADVPKHHPTLFSICSEALDMVIKSGLNTAGLEKPMGVSHGGWEDD